MYKLMGYRMVDFTDKTGKHVSGVSLYVSYPLNGVNGSATDKLFVRPELFRDLAVVPGDDLDIRFNRFGKVDSITLV